MYIVLSVFLFILLMVWCFFSASEWGPVMIPINTVIGFVVGHVIGTLLYLS